MLIISKEKDYYDYLSGIYGVEPNLVYDRRNSETRELDYADVLIICGKVYELYTVDGVTYFGEDLEPLKVDSSQKRFYYHSDYVEEIRKNANPVKLEGANKQRYYDYVWVCKDVYDDPYDLNVKYDAPILLLSLKNYLNDSSRNFLNPNLSKLNLGSLIPAEELYLMLTTWLGLRVERLKETTIPTTDNQKIVNKGFDLKTSFRPNIKKS